MLHKLHIYFFTALVLLLTNCTTTKDLPVKSQFQYQYQGESYQIISINAPSGEGMNFLLQFRNDSTIFRTIDSNQDGIIDLIQYGPVSMEQANHIYAYGIEQAIAQHKFKTRDTERLFEYSAENFEYIVQTFGYYHDVLYNEFAIRDLSSDSLTKYLDLNSDGELDQIIEGEKPIEEAQKLYKQVLQNGIEQNRIQVRSKKYVVTSISRQQPS